MTIHVLWPAVRWPEDLHIETQGLGPGVTAHFSRRVEDVAGDVRAIADGIVGGPDLPDETIAKMPRCRVHVRAAVGFDNFDVARRGRHGIPVCNTPHDALKDGLALAARTAARYRRDGRLENCVNEQFLKHRRRPR